MFGRFLPQEGRFFELFGQHADQVVAGGRELVALMTTINEGNGALHRHAEAIDEYETRADKITHETVSLLHKTFITPLEREDIHQLINCMDDILDTIQDVAESLTLYDIRKVTPDAVQLADICLSTTERVRTAVTLLSNMDNAPGIVKTCQEIDRLESLFRDEADVRQLIKLKAIYELLESVTDRCLDAANVIEGIVLENS